jgi:ATP-dependent Clp protease protease subunit
MGTAEDMRAMAEALDKVKGSLVSGYAAKSGRTPEDVSALMAAETWFDAGDAVAQGFADRLIEPVRIAARFDIGRFRNAPPVLVEQVEAEPEPGDDTDGTNTEATDDVADGDPVEDDEVAAPDTSEPSAQTPPPSGAPPDPAAIRAEAIGHARAVVDLCRLAGQPQMAGQPPRSGTRASTRCARRSSQQRPRSSPRSRPITRSPAAPRPRAPGARSSPAPSS